jgi:carbon starvation protein
MQDLSKEMGEPSLIGKIGGAPTFAVGMAMMFHRVFSGTGLLKFWYHFAIMFEALFILTTLDAGTRVGRFILQDLLGQVSPKLRETSSLSGNVLASFLLVAAWGFFLYQGAVEPDGIAKSLWPIFGIANQLLAVIAFCLGTTILIKMGKARYAWCTAIPLVFLTLVTFTAGFMKLFSANAAGFIPAAEKLTATLAKGGLTPEDLANKERALFVTRVDIGVTSLFLVLVAIIVVGCVIEWTRLLSGSKAIVLRESPAIPLAEGV